VVTGSLACGGEGKPSDVLDNRPVGSDAPSAAAFERFVRRATLDLNGKAPSASEVDAAAQKLLASTEPLAERRALVDALLTKPAFASLYVSELEARAFGGQSRADRSAFACLETAAANPACASCTTGDLCACSCAPVREVAAQNTAIEEAAAQLEGGATTASIERLFAESYVTYAGSGGDPTARATHFFEVFLGRTPEPEESENAVALILGPLVDDGTTIVQSASGLVFGAHGKTFADLVELTFSSEVYREATVRAVFRRYLGREPSAVEILHFTRELDADAPDVKPIVREVIASKEYFEQ
jgi:hypothetical protein